MRRFILPLFCLIFGLSGCARTPDQSNANSSDKSWLPPQGQSYTVRVTGENFNWHIEYPGPDGKLDTSDDIRSLRDLHLPSGTQVKVDLASKDYIYTLTLPRYGVREIAVPDLNFSMNFTTEEPGTYELLGDQMCGYAHPDLLGKLFVQSPEDFAAWSRKARQIQP